MASSAPVERTVTAALVVLVTALVAVPIAAVAIAAIRDAGPAAFLAIVSSPRIILNTLVVGAGSTVLAVLAGGALALALVRIDTPGRRLLERLMIIPLYLTPLLTAIAWSWLGSPRGGLINKAARDLFGIAHEIINLQTPAGIVVITALACAPLPFLLIGGALRAMDPSLEESARVQGATPVATFRLVTLPLVIPAALGSGLLVFVQAVGLFSVPAVLGMPGGFYVATTEIYRLLENYPPRVGQAAIWGLLLLAVTAILIRLQTVILARRSFVTITGKAFRPRPVALGPSRYVLAAGAWIYVTVAVLLPVATLCWAASINFLTVDFHQMTFGLRHFRYVLLEYPKTYLATRNSVLLGVATASLVCALGLIIGWVVTRSRGLARTYLDQLSMAPLSVPAMVFALGLLWVYVGFRLLPIYNTIWILLLAYVAHYLPFGVRAAAGALHQLHPDLEAAARVSGAGFGKMVRYVTFPLTRPTLAAAWTLVLVMAMQEVSASILLYSSRSVVLSVAVFDLWEAGNQNALAALSVMQLAVTFAALLIVSRAGNREVFA